VCLCSFFELGFFMAGVSKDKKANQDLDPAPDSRISERATATAPPNNIRQQIGKQAGKVSFDTSKLDQQEIVKQILGNVG